MTRALLQSLFETEIDELYVALGREVQPPSLGMEPTPDKRSAEEGKSWLERNRAELADRLCGTTVVKVYRESKQTADRVLAAAAVADLISSLVTGVAAATAAVLLIKEGLDTLCRDR